MTENPRNFDNEAASWDDKPDRVKLAADITFAIRQNVPLSTDMDVLDFGCGTGLLTLALQPYVRFVTGVDSSRGMLAVLQRKIDQANLANVKTVLLDLDRGDRLSGSYDLITSSMTLHHIPDIDALFCEFHRILKPSGLIAVADLDPDDGQFHSDNTGVYSFGFDRIMMRDKLARSGFQRISIIDAAHRGKTLSDGSTRQFCVFLATAQKQATGTLRRDCD